MDGGRGGGGLLAGNDFLWAEHRRLAEDNARLTRANARLAARVGGLEDALADAEAEARRLDAENRGLRRRVKDLADELKAAAAAAAAAATPAGAGRPPFAAKPNVPAKRKRATPGRPAGHAAALRPMPAVVDTHRAVPLPVDGAGVASCPRCHTRLSDVKDHERLVEDLVPHRVVVTCYHSASGYCPSCRRRVESRAAEQPPAAPGVDLPHAQLGIEALATAAMLRVAYRLPLRQVTSLLAAVPGLGVSAGALVKQLKRMARWLLPAYGDIRAALRVASVLHADETHWRVGGKNGHLWTLTDGDGDGDKDAAAAAAAAGHHTLYHVDRSRGRGVIRELLGEGYGSDGGTTLVADFYAAYDGLPGPKQRCLAHLQRELKDLTAARPALAAHAFFRRGRRLVRDMLRLRQRKGALDEHVYERRVRRVEGRLAKLADRHVTDDDADAARLAKRLSKHRDDLTRFLHDPAVPATNNAAERALRPAVVMRKVTGGNRTASGAGAWAVLASVMRTARQQGKGVMDELRTRLKQAWTAETGMG